MSSLNHYIKFLLNIKDQNLEFLDFNSQLIHGVKTKVFEALLNLDHCLFCHSKHVKRNLTDLLNTAKYPQSKGCLEGVNRKIKQIERTAYGYRNFSHLVARIKLEEAKTVVKEKHQASK